MSEEKEAPKKISLDQIEVVGVGVHDHSAKQTSGQGETPRINNPFASGGVKVFKGGPLSALVFVPLTLVLLPLLLVGLFVLMIAALFLGKSVFRIVKLK